MKTNKERLTEWFARHDGSRHLFRIHLVFPSTFESKRTDIAAGEIGLHQRIVFASLAQDLSTFNVISRMQVKSRHEYEIVPHRKAQFPSLTIVEISYSCRTWPS